MIDVVNTNADIINATLSEKAESVGYTLSDSMQSIWDTNITGVTTILTTYGQNIQNGIESATTTVNTTLSNISINIQEMIAYLDKIAQENIKDIDDSSAINLPESNVDPKPTENKPKTPADNPKVENKNKEDKTKNSIKVGGKINAGSAKIYGYAGDKSGERQYFRNDPIYTVLKEYNGWLQVRWHKLSSGITGWFKKSDVKAYATGKRNFLSNEIAWTQDGGSEMIIRPSDGAILTPIAKGDSVLSSIASNNIWNMANDPAKFIMDSLKSDNNVSPINHNGQTQYTQHLDKVVFNLPNVKNYDELLSSMQHDKNFERLIMAMTIDRVAGKSSLLKGKSIR